MQEDCPQLKRHGNVVCYLNEDSARAPHLAGRPHAVPHDIRPVLLAGHLKHGQVRLQGPERVMHTLRQIMHKRTGRALHACRRKGEMLGMHLSCNDGPLPFDNVAEAVQAVILWTLCSRRTHLVEIVEDDSGDGAIWPMELAAEELHADHGEDDCYNVQDKQEDAGGRQCRYNFADNRPSPSMRIVHDRDPSA